MPGMPADIDLSIQYSDTETKRLDRDLQRIKQTAIEIQKKFDSIDLKKLQAQFKGLEAIALRAFGKGLQSAISAVTRRIGGQREAVKSLIRQYAILASVQARMAKPMITSASGKGVAQEKWMMGQAAGWHAEQKADKMLKGPSGYRELAGRPDSDKLISKGLRGYRELQREPFEKFQKTHDITETKTANQAASTKRYEDMMLRRAGIAKDLQNTEMTTADLAKKYGKSQATILRDKKAIAQENMKALVSERKIRSMATHPEQIRSQQIPPWIGKSLEPTKQFTQKDIAAGQKAAARYPIQSKIDAYQNLGKISQPPIPPKKGLYDDTFKTLARGRQEVIPPQKTPAQKHLETYRDLGKISQQPSSTKGFQIGAVPSSYEGMLDKTSRKYAPLKNNAEQMRQYSKNIDAAIQKIDTLDKAQKQLAKERTKAIKKGAPAQQAAVEKEMLNNASKRQAAEDSLRKNIDARNLASTQNVSTQKTLTQEAEKTTASLDKHADLTKKISTESKASSAQDQAATQRKLAMLDKIEAANKKGLAAAKQAGKTADIEKYEKSLLDNAKKRNELLSKGTQEVNKQAAATKKASTQQTSSGKKTLAQLKAQGEARIEANKAAPKPMEDYIQLAKDDPNKSGKDAKRNANTIQNAAEKTNKARKSEAQTFDNYAKRYEHAQGRVNAAMVKARRNVSLIPKTSKHYQAQADALGELQNLSRGLGSEKNQAAAFKSYQKDADRLFNTVTKGAKESKKHMGFMNKAFAKFSIIMSGMAATMFVWQQLSAIVGAFIRHGTKLEETFVKIEDRFKKTNIQMQMLSENARKAGQTGILTASAYAELVASFEEGGYTAAQAIETVNASIERERKLLKGTVSGELKQFFGLMGDVGTLLFTQEKGSFIGFLESINREIEKIVNSKSDLETVIRMVSASAKVSMFPPGGIGSTDPIIDAINPTKNINQKMVQKTGEVLGIKDAEEMTDLYVGILEAQNDMVVKSWMALDVWTVGIIKKVGSLGAKAGRALNLDPVVDGIENMIGALSGSEVKSAAVDMWEYNDSLIASASAAEAAAKSIADTQQMAKQLSKDMEKAFKILGDMPLSMVTKRAEEMRITLLNLKKALSPEDYKKVEEVLNIQFDRSLKAPDVSDYTKFYSVLRRYSAEHYDYELKRIRDNHIERMAKGALSEKESTQQAKKEFKILEKRKAASFVSSEKKLLETLGITSGTQIEVGIAFNEKTGKVTATKMMTYLDLLNYNTEQTIKAMNANFGKIGKTIPKNLGIQDFKSKGGPEITKYMKEAASQYDLDPNILEQIGRKETGGFQPDIVSGKQLSPKGAIGTMQLMPDTAKKLGVDPFNLKENIMGGAKYFKQLLDQFSGDLKLTLAAYNAGPGAVKKYGDQIPPYKETQDYVSTITQKYGSDQMRQPQPYGPRKPQPIIETPKPFEIEIYGPRMKQLAEGQEGVENQRQATRSQALKREGIFKNKQMLASFDQKIYKKAYDKLGLMTDKFYKNELAIINHFEEQNTDILGKSHAKKIADKARFNLDWQKKTADQLKVSQDALQMMEKSFQTTDIYSPVLAKRGKLKIEETKERLAKTKIPQKDQQVITKTMEITEYENINKARVNIDQQYFNQSKVMTDFLYQYKKDKIMKEIDLQILKSDGTLNAEQLLIDRLQALNDEYGQHRTQAWKTMYESTGKYSQQFAESEIKRLERLRDEMIRLTGDVAAANEMFKREKTKIDIVVNLKSEDAMAGMEALRLQMSLETETLAEAVNKNLKTIIDGTKEAFGETLYDTMQGNFENIWDLFESMGDRFKQMIDRMVSDYLASQLAQGLFGDLFEGGSGGGVAKDLIGAVLGGFSGSSSGPSPIVGSTGTTAMFMAKGGIIDEPTKFMKMASGGMINNRMTSGAIEIGEAGPEAVMPLKRSKSGKLGIETSAGITAPLKRLASGNLGIDASLFDGGSMKKMAKGGIITKPTMFYGGTNDSIKRLASGDIINEPIAPSLGPTISPTVDLPPTPESTISAATSTMQAVEPVTQTFDTPWHGNLSSGFESGTKLKSGGVAYQAATEAIGAANTDQAAQHRWAPLVQNVPFNEFEDMFLSAAKIKTKRIQDMGPDTYLSDMASKTKAQMNLEDPRYQFAKGGVINKPTIFTKLAKGGVISQNMVSVEQSMIQKDQSFKPPNTTGLGMGGIINKKTIFRDGDYLGKTIHMASGGVISSPFSSGGIEIGEAGPEVVMPLTKTSSGKLGVAAIGSGSSSQPNITNTFNINVTAPKGKIDQSSMNQLQTKLGISVQRSMRRNA